jgi:hypothetical protein
MGILFSYVHVYDSCYVIAARMWMAVCGKQTMGAASIL